MRSINPRSWDAIDARIIKQRNVRSARVPVHRAETLGAEGDHTNKNMNATGGMEFIHELSHTPSRATKAVNRHLS
jgi:hypothetical protein